jgi:prevent-host-death family protein
MKMLKKISAMKARQNLGRIMNEVSLRGDDYIIERAGKPLVAVISIEKFQALQKDKAAAAAAFEQILGKMKDEDPKAVAKTINEAVKAAKSV